MPAGYPWRWLRLTASLAALFLATFMCLVFTATPLLADTKGSDANPWFAAHTFYGTCGCLAVREGKQLREGDGITVFDVDKPTAKTRVSYVADGDSAKQVFVERGFNGVYRDKALWERVGCYWCLRSDPFPSFARYRAPVSGEEISVPLAFRELPASALEIGGDGQPLSQNELRDLMRGMAETVPEAFTAGRILQAGRRYRSAQGEELSEVFLGKPSYNTRRTGAPLDSIEIYHAFIKEGQLLSAERFSRVSGSEERVDVEPPQLDEGNWFQTLVETLGFLSMDGGVTWYWLSADLGFEGILWSISRLTEGMPQSWNSYLYTIH